MTEATPEAFRDALYKQCSKGEHFDNMINELYQVAGPTLDLFYKNMKKGNIVDNFQSYTGLTTFLTRQIFSYIKFFDHNLPEDDADNFYFEREWRIMGNLEFAIEDIKTVFLPKKDAKKFRKDCPEYFGQLLFT